MGIREGRQRSSRGEDRYPEWEIMTSKQFMKNKPTSLPGWVGGCRFGNVTKENKDLTSGTFQSWLHTMDGHVGHTSFRTNIQEMTVSAASYLMMTEEWLTGIPVFKLQGRANCLSIVMATSWRIYLFPSFFPLPSPPRTVSSLHHTSLCPSFLPQSGQGQLSDGAASELGILLNGKYKGGAGLTRKTGFISIRYGNYWERILA